MSSLAKKIVPRMLAQSVRDYRHRIFLTSYDFIQLTWAADAAYSAVFPFESRQIDSRYWMRHKMHKLGIWINVNVYLFIWINVQTYFCSLVALKANLLFDVHLDEWTLSWPQLHLSFHTWHPESLSQSFWVNLYQRAHLWLGSETCLPWLGIRLNSKPPGERSGKD